MTPKIVAYLVALNQAFYEQFGSSFSDSRSRPQPGFAQLLQHLPPNTTNVLDVGCGDGRFGRFLQREIREWRLENETRRVGDWEIKPTQSPSLIVSHSPIGLRYTGVDFSERLLAIAREAGPGEFFQRDLVQPSCLTGLGEFDVVACLAALHHIPGYANRLRLLREMAEHLRPGGRLFLATWQFLTNERQRRKLRDWSLVGLDAADVEPGDYLLSWEREGQGLRYVAMIDEAAVAQMATEAGLTMERQFYSDGREGNLSLYTILRGE